MKHGLATFVYESLKWSLIGQASDNSEIEWLCVDVDSSMIISMSTSRHPQGSPLYRFPLILLPVSTLATSTASILTGGYHKINEDGECLSIWAANFCVPHWATKPAQPPLNCLFRRLDQKRLERWNETINTIEFSHSSHLAWSIVNNLTGRSARSLRKCPISANSIASQLKENGSLHGALGTKSSLGQLIKKCLICGGWKQQRKNACP